MSLDLKYVRLFKMRINRIRVSNVLNFSKSNENTNSGEVIIGPNINYFVGANGSGKSNICEIAITLLKKKVYKECSLNTSTLKSIIQSQKTDFKNFSLIEYPKEEVVFEKHRECNKHEQRVEIDCELTKSDFRNIKLIQDNKSYSNGFKEFVGGSLDYLQSLDVDNLNNEIKYIFKSSTDNTIKVDSQKGDKRLIQYLKDFNEIYKSAELTAILYPKENFINKLNNNKIILTANRSINNINNNLFYIDLNDSSTKFLTSESYNPLLTIKNNSNNTKIKNELVNFAFQYAKIRDKYPKEDHAKKFNDLENYLSLQKDIKDLLGYNFIFENISNGPHSHIYQGRIELNNISIDFKQLSSGELEILRLLFILNSKALKDGFLIIDEPELHLHPTASEKVISYLKDKVRLANEGSKSLQIILNTHSSDITGIGPEEVIHKFTKTSNNISSISLDNFQNSKTILNFIQYSKKYDLFFKDYIILVEGDSDSIFYQWYFNKIIGNENDKNLLESVCFSEMGGKTNQKNWQNFLNLLNIKHALILDFDNVENLKILYPKTEITYKTDKGKLKFNFNKLIQLRKTDNKKLNETDENIIKLRDSNKYILRYGDLETYLPNSNIENKKSRVIEFCSNPDSINHINNDNPLNEDLKSICAEIYKSFQN